MSRPHLAHATPAHPRDSGIHAIGNLLSTPYDTDDDELDRAYAETLSSSLSSPGSGPVSAGAVRMRQPVARAAEQHAQWALDAKVRSCEGEVAGVPQYAPYDHAPAPPQPAPRQQPHGAARRPPTVVEFPEPTLQPSDPRQRPHPMITTLLPPPPPSIFLPPPASPISPLLAAPPAPHYSPLTSASSRASPSSPGSPHGRRASNASESIRGFDAMAEKAAFFREGQDELMLPFSPRKTSGLRHGARAASGMDFWKRFSVSVRLDEAEKKKKPSSDWLSKAQGERGNIKKIAIVVLLLVTLVVIGAVVAGVLVHKAHSGSSSSTTTGNL